VGAFKNEALGVSVDTDLEVSAPFREELAVPPLVARGRAGERAERGIGLAQSVSGEGRLEVFG
jgi:hypothetical protein